MLYETANAALDTTTSWTSPLFWPNMDPGDFILTIISLFVLIAWILSILFILRGGLLLILSWGKDDKIKPAINTIRYAVIWVVITVVAIFVFPVLWKLLWIDVEKYANPTAIFRKIEDIWNNVFWTSSSSNNSIWTDSWNSTWWIPADFSDL